MASEKSKSRKIISPPWKVGMGVLLALILLRVAHCEGARAWLGIDLANVTALQNRIDKPCRAEMELRRTIQHPEGEQLPTGWALCPEVRVQYRVLSVIVGEKVKK